MDDDNDHQMEDAALTHIILDLISSALGGAILLGIILSISRASKPAAGATAPFLLVRLSVGAAGDKVPDSDVLPNLWVKPPGASEGFDLPLEQFDLVSGRSKPGATLEPRFASLMATGNQFHVIGFYRHGEGDARVNLVESSAPGSPIFMLYVAEPTPGVWSFRARYQNRRDLDELLAAGKPVPPISVELVGHVAQDSAAKVVGGRIEKFGNLSPSELTLEVQARPRSGASPAKAKSR